MKERCKSFDVNMGESFQYYSWIQDFEADFLELVSIKIPN